MILNKNHNKLYNLRKKSSSKLFIKKIKVNKRGSLRETACFSKYKMRKYA